MGTQKAFTHPGKDYLNQIQKRDNTRALQTTGQGEDDELERTWESDERTWITAQLCTG